LISALSRPSCSVKCGSWRTEKFRNQELRMGFHSTTGLDHADNPASSDDLRLCVLCVVLGCWRGCSPLLLACHPPRCKLFFLLHHVIPVVPNDVFCMLSSAQWDSFAILPSSLAVQLASAEINCKLFVHSVLQVSLLRVPLLPPRRGHLSVAILDQV
jgi:hypothetical protein